MFLSPPFCREVGIYPLAEPGLEGAPAQPFTLQQLKHTRGTDRNAALLTQIRRQPRIGPTGEGLAQRLRRAERGRHYLAHLLETAHRLGITPTQLHAEIDRVLASITNPISRS